MTKPQRYGVSSMPCESGLYVLHKDYLALEAECERLRGLARKQYYELEGVIIDTERGRGFDEVCLNTIKRVQCELASMSEEQA